MKNKEMTFSAPEYEPFIDKDEIYLEYQKKVDIVASMRFKKGLKTFLENDSLRKDIIAAQKQNILEAYEYYIGCIILSLDKKIKMNNNVVLEANKVIDEFYDKVKDFNITEYDLKTGKYIVKEYKKFNHFCNIGFIFHRDGSLKNYEKTLKWFKLALELENAEYYKKYAEITYCIATYYKYGLAGLEENENEMLYWLNKGVNRGFGYSELELANYYSKEGELEKAKELRKKAKSHGVKVEKEIENLNGNLANIDVIFTTITNAFQLISAVKSLFGSNNNNKR